MTSPGHFDPLQLPLTERLLLEASAGTGKTHTITTLYLRLLLERELRVEQILVLTFTRAATDELRRRIRGRISDCLDACGDGDDRSIAPESVELLERAESLARAGLLLKAALASFDQSAIVTIHGFADRVLRDYAFETGRPLELELEEDLPAQLRMVTLDYWRGITAGASGRFNRYLRANNFTPSSLPRWVETQMNRSAAEIRLPNRSDPEQAEERLQGAVERLRGIWAEEQENIAARLLAAPLNRNSYGPEKIRGWLLEIGAGLNRDEADATAVLGQKWAANLTPEILSERTKKGGQVPQHAFFDQWAVCVEAAAALDGVYQSVLIHLRHSALEYVSRELPRRLRQLGTQSYSDLLVELERALQSSHRLADALAAAYPAALVDEFQDTDPLQYGLLQKIYARSSSCVVFVGDPKQAIYQFRGADVYAYLQAARNTPGGGQLLENWRSDPELIGAVNTLFQQREAPFLEPAIRFHPAGPAERQRRRYQDPAGRPEPLQLWWLHRDGEKRVTVEQGQQRAAAATASEVARLLSRGSGVGAALAGAPLSGRDISILVATNRQGRLMRLALQQRGLASVFQGDSSVFESEEAEALQRILAAVLDPGERGRLRGALVTDLLGYELAAVASRGLDEAVDHELLHQEITQFRGYHQRWRDAGFYPMFTALLADYRVPQRLLKLPDGARRLTNLRHLAELMHAESRRHTGDIHAEYDWFADQRRDAKQQRENRKLRLESDEKLVQIMTVHGSKGLQFPVVFVPFSWTSEGADREGEGSYYHPGEQGPAGLGAVLDLRPVADQERDVVAQAELERWSESLRLLYVALTRAEHRCYFSWALAGKSRGNIGCSAAAWLLHAGGQAQESLSDFITRVQGMSAEEGLRQLSDLAAGSARGISVVEPAYDDQVSAAPGTGAAAVGLARVARRALAPGGGITSFTALQRSGGAVHLSPHQFSGVDTLEPTQVPESPIMDFPRGAVAGNCLHQILESVDYRFDPGEIRGEVERGLVHYGFGPEWSEVVTHGIHDVLRTPLLAGCNLTLAAVEERVNELEFRYPLASRIAGDLAMGAGENPDQQAVAGLFSRLPQVGWPGYMKGYIDLLFQYEGRYYLADFKSNWLGLCYSDYAPPRLTASMDREGYRLQYLLYSLALHRLLRWRLPDYDYQAHFGGVFYLYLRGMSSERGPANGVWFRRPSSVVIETLERQFGE